MCKNQCFSGKMSMPGMVNSQVNQHNRLRARIWPLRAENLHFHAFTHAITIIHSSTNLSFAFISTLLVLPLQMKFFWTRDTHTYTHISFHCTFINRPLYYSRRPNVGNEDIEESISFDGPDAAVVLHAHRSLDSVIAMRAKRTVLLSLECSIM